MATSPPLDPITAAAHRGAKDGLARVTDLLRQISRVADQIDPSDDGDPDDRTD